MFATLIPKSPDLMVIAGILADQRQLVISVVSPRSQQIEVSYQEVPTNFREHYCYECSYYEDNNEFESGLDYEDYFDEEAYNEALEDARQNIDPSMYESMEDYEQDLSEELDNVSKDDFYDEVAYDQDLEEERREWENSLCEGGCDVLYDEACHVYEISDVTSDGTVIHTTLPHVYQYIHQFHPDLPSSNKLQWNRYNDNDSIFAIREVPGDIEGEVKFQCAPYEIGNVFNQGNICWGDNDMLNNVRIQYNLFWSSAFNNDLVPDSNDISYWLEDFHLYKDRLKWESISPELFFGTQGISTDEKTEREIEGILFLPTYEPNTAQLDLKRTLLTWIFKDDEGQYFAYNTLLPQRPIIRLTMEEGYFDSIKL